jgi:hypothetical protein
VTLPYLVNHVKIELTMLKGPRVILDKLKCYHVFLGPIMVVVHKRNVSPKTHFQDTTLNDRVMFTNLFISLNSFSIRYSHIL